MKKKVIIGSTFLLMLALSGCGKVIELTDSENHLVAEYAAELLLKYDHNIDDKYYSAESVKEVTTAEASTTETVTTETTTQETQTTEEKPAATSSDASTEDKSKTTTKEGKDSDKDSGKKPYTSEAQGGQMEDVEDAGKASQDKNFDIASLAGDINASVKYSYYMLLDQYPSLDKDGVAITIEAPSGYKLLVLKFNLENKTNEEQYIDLYSKELEYKVIVNDDKAAKQMLTILMDDLYTYQANVEANMFQEVVLLFQVSDSVAEDINSLKLSVTDNTGKSTIIDLE